MMRSVRLLEVFSKLIYSFGFLSRELRTQFFIGLAALFSLFTILYFIDAFFGGKTEQSLDYDAGSLDFAMDWRLSSPDANHDIVIIDIDERSLAIMAEVAGKSIPEVGTTMFRPPYTPTAIGAFAGRSNR